MATATGNTLYLGSAITVQGYSDSTNIVTITPSTTLTGLQNPINSSDAVNKGWLDTQISSIIGLDNNLLASQFLILNTAINTYESSDLAYVNTLSSTLSTTNSTAVVLSSALTSEINSRILAITATNSSVTSLATGLTSETTRATAVEGTINANLTNEINSRISAITATNSTAVVLSTAVSTGLSTEISVRASAVTSLATGLTATNSTAVVLSTGLTSETTRATAAEGTLTTSITSLATGLTATNSTAVVLSTAVSTGLSTEISVRASAVTSLATGLTSETTRATVAEGTLSTNLLTELSVRASAVTSLATGLTATNSTAVVLSSGISTNLSTNFLQGTTITTSLATGLTSETTRATAAEGTLTTSITSLTTGLTTTNSTAVVLSTAISTNLVTLNTVQRMAIKTQIVPINTFTIPTAVTNGITNREPQYIPTYPINATNLLDGWTFVKPVSNTTDYINWGNTLTNTNNALNSVILGSNIAQIYFTCYIPVIPASDASWGYHELPMLQISILTGSTVSTLTFKMLSSAMITAPGNYTFIANLNDPVGVNSNYFNSEVVLLSYVGTVTYTGVSQSLYASNLTAVEGATTAAVFNYISFIMASIQFISVKSSPLRKSNFIISNIQTEVVSNGNFTIIPGTYEFLFTNATVNDKYMHNAINYLYSALYKNNVTVIVPIS